jgi:hypothetical protein
MALVQAVPLLVREDIEVEVSKTAMFRATRLSAAWWRASSASRAGTISCFGALAAD